jgi:hypothetical protein
MEGELVFCVSVVRVRPRTSRSITDLLLALAYMYFVAYRAPRRSRSPELSLGKSAAVKLAERTLTNQARRTELHRCETGDYWEAEISFVIGINQTNHSTNQEWPCTTVQRIKKELSICQSQLRPDLVTFPVLSQIKPHTPRLVVPFRQFL